MDLSDFVQLSTSMWRRGTMCTIPVPLRAKRKFLLNSFIYKYFSDDRSTCVQAELNYIQQNVQAEESAALVFPNEDRTGVCPVSWLQGHIKDVGSTVSVDWEGTVYEATILLISRKIALLSP